MANVFIENQGRLAWQQHGVTGESNNPYRSRTEEWLDWLNGFSVAMWAARFAALDDARAAFYA